jgi:hypothetical protein
MLEESIFRRLEDMNLSENDGRRLVVLDNWDNEFFNKMKRYQDKAKIFRGISDHERDLFLEMNQKLANNKHSAKFTKWFAWKKFD